MIIELVWIALRISRVLAIKGEGFGSLSKQGEGLPALTCNPKSEPE